MQQHERQHQGQHSVPEQRNSMRFFFILLTILAALGAIYFYLIPFLSSINSSGTQTNTDGQCLSNGQQFNGRQEAFTLAQMAEQYRTGHRFNGNYGYASYTLCYKDGSQRRVPSPVAPGYDNTKDKTKPLNYTHSEQILYRWLQKQLATVSSDPKTLAAVYVIIFSQVRVCDACVSSMVSWQSSLRQIAKTSLLYLAIWDIRPGTPSAFIPTVFPGGTGTPVAIADLRRVSIPFT
jgi:hypothetical protein